MNLIKVTASLTIKKNNYYVVTYYKDIFNKAQRKTHRTGIKAIKSNKKIAERKKEEIRLEYEIEINENATLSSLDNYDKSNIKFCDFITNWLETIKPTISETTYAGYRRIIHGKLFDYFNKLGTTLKDLKAYEIQNFYSELYKLNLKGNTISKYHANIRKALQRAVKMEIIPSNPADNVERPKIEPYISSYYNKSELQALFEVLKDTNIKIPTLITTYYGLQRGETLGLKWDAINFDDKTIIIRHTVTQTKVDGKLQVVARDKTKNKSSYRSLPLIPEIEEILLKEKQLQCENKKLFKSEYKNNDGYICVYDDGSLIKPDYLSHKFHDTLKKNNLRNIRFHELRHSCTTLLLHNNIHMKDIQVWLGHSNYNTTANLYSHVDISSKVVSANLIGNILGNNHL